MARHRRPARRLVVLGRPVRWAVVVLTLALLTAAGTAVAARTGVLAAGDASGMRSAPAVPGFRSAGPTASTGAASASAAAASALSAKPASPVATAPLTADGGRAFSPSAAWNTLLPQHPALDPDSAAMVAGITASNRAAANLYEYGEPVFTAGPSSPTATVTCTMDWGTCDLENRAVRIPAEARPTTGTDGRMIIVDLVARTSCDFWQARREGVALWSASWGTCASLDGDGRGPGGGSTGAGVNALTGVVRTFEMRALDIPHALSVATDNSCSGVFRYPAEKTDGSSRRADCVPEGARLQLDPAVDVDALPGITPGERAVAHALQRYGAINRDNAGTPLCVQFEAPFGQADPYPAAGFPGDYYPMPHIPWNRLRVLHG